MDTKKKKITIRFSKILLRLVKRYEIEIGNHKRHGQCRHEKQQEKSRVSVIFFFHFNGSSFHSFHCIHGYQKYFYVAFSFGGLMNLNTIMPAYGCLCICKHMKYQNIDYIFSYIFNRSKPRENLYESQKVERKKKYQIFQLTNISRWFMGNLCKAHENQVFPFQYEYLRSKQIFFSPSLVVQFNSVWNVCVCYQCRESLKKKKEKKKKNIHEKQKSIKTHKLEV